jgi:NADPH-dependent ferric siderophore reductase
MPDRFSDEDTVTIDAVVEHLNGNHADTVLFVARHHPALGGLANLVDAEIDGIDPAGATFSTRDVSGATAAARLDFAAPLNAAAEVQHGLFALVAAAREAAPDAPLTSIEAELSVSATLTTTLGRVAEVRSLTPNLVEVTVELDDLVPLRGGDEYFWVMIGEGADDVVDGFTMEDADDGGPVRGAYYTVRSHRPTAREIDLWVVLHGEDDCVATRLTSATPGHRVAMWGPRPGYEPPTDADTMLLAADETGFAAVAALVDAAPLTVQITAVVETVDELHHVALPERASLDVHWVHRGDAHPGTHPGLLDTIRRVVASPPDAAFGAAESRQITAVRRHLRGHLAMPAAHVRMTGYWRHA